MDVSDTSSNRSDQLANFAAVLRNAPARQKVFEAVYRGKKKVKTAAELAIATNCPTTKRLTEIAKPLVNQKLFNQGWEKINGRNQTVYKKISFIDTTKKTILRLARNHSAFSRFPTKSNPTVRARTVERLVLKVPFKLKTRFVSIEDVEQFVKAKQVGAASTPLVPNRLPEHQFKKGLLKLLGETKIPKDWGGETNDIFTTKLRIGAHNRRAAFALKGPGKSGKLVPGKMGKNGDQIQRLFGSPAEVFFIQYEGEVAESVIGEMEAWAKLKAGFGQEVLFGIIDGDASSRLRRAYPKAFEP
jgi:hypothetical protein